MKKLLILFVIGIINNVRSQNFYEVKWVSNNINYTALIEFFTTENINVRVKYTSKGKYKVAKYTSKAFYDSAKDCYLILGDNAKVVYPYSAQNTASYSADNFYFTNRNYNNVYQDLYVYDNNAIKSDGSITGLEKATYKVLNPFSDFTEQYIYNFFEKHEPEYTTYTNLINGNVSNYDTTYANVSSSYSTLASSNSNHFKLKFKNKCHEKISTLIRYKNANDEWETKGWWEIKPGQTAYVEDTKNSIFYFYAKSTESTKEWRGEDNFKSFNGRKYGLIKKSTDQHFGDWTTNLTCNNSGGGGATVSNTKIHLIFAADVEDPSIGNSTREDMNDITNLFKKAAKELGVTFKHHKLYGDHFDKNSINSTIDNLSIGTNDVIIFYYSGHGYNNTNTYNKFPNMSLDGADLSLESIHSKLKYKKARLLLTIGDLCNSIPRMRNRTTGQTEIPFKSGFLFDNRKLKRLFIETKGDLISTSSQKGQWSFTMGNGDNGHFTNAFIDAFTNEVSKVSNHSGSWISLFNNAYDEAKYKTRDTKNQDGSYGQTGTNTNNLRR